LVGFPDEGLNLEVDEVRGYRLIEPLILLDRDLIGAAISPSLQKSLACFEVHQTIDSTNSQAMRWLSSGGRGQGLFLAEQQLSGRGRRGRTWVSPPARNIYLTVVWPVPDLQSALGGLSLVTALSLVDGLRAAGVQGGESLRVKWPNDVWLGDAKLAGILLELHGAQSSSAHVIIGMGINVSLSERDRASIDQAATDLCSWGNSAIDRNSLVAAILSRLEKNLQQLFVSGFEPFRAQWSRLDALHGQEVEITDGKRRLNGMVKGVGATGALILQSDDGDQQVSGGEVAPSLRPVSTAAEQSDQE
jgi:BirA family biotin operon repressor/biotin-[acetyl-CoA-carboxylase] ligase